MKRIFNESKQNELSVYDLSLGKLVEDKLFIAHHEATQEVHEQSHMEVLKTYANGGRDVQTVIDVPYKAAKEAYDEYEDIFVFVPYTAAELAANKERKYKLLVESKIRQKYSINDEVALLRQAAVKPNEYAEYNAYCENCKTAAKQEVNV